MGRLSAQGKYIYQDGQKFFARGVSYGPFAPNSRRESYPEPDRVAADFALMGELGANLVRTYVIPPPWMFELAARYGLRLMAGDFMAAAPDLLGLARDGARHPQHGPARNCRDCVSSKRRSSPTASAMRSVPISFAGMVRVRSAGCWLSCTILARNSIPTGLFTYSNYPSAEYLDLSFLDVISFNVYLHRETDFRRYLTHLMSITGERPLVLSETGIDTIREGEQHQAEVLSWQSRAALELGLSGLVIFAFTDEWFRGGSEITDWAFGITTRERAPKPSFAAVSRIFRGPLPPTLTSAPAASVVVPAYDAVPNDWTMHRIAEATQLSRITRLWWLTTVRPIPLPQSRNPPGRARSGCRIADWPLRVMPDWQPLAVASLRFIDADAEADRDWLYHLAEVHHSAPRRLPPVGRISRRN